MSLCFHFASLSLSLWFAVVCSSTGIFKRKAVLKTLPCPTQLNNIESPLVSAIPFLMLINSKMFTYDFHTRFPIITYFSFRDLNTKVYYNFVFLCVCFCLCCLFPTDFSNPAFQCYREGNWSKGKLNQISPEIFTCYYKFFNISRKILFKTTTFSDMYYIQLRD